MNKKFTSQKLFEAYLFEENLICLTLDEFDQPSTKASRSNSPHGSDGVLAPISGAGGGVFEARFEMG